MPGEIGHIYKGVLSSLPRINTSNCPARVDHCHKHTSSLVLALTIDWLYEIGLHTPEFIVNELLVGALLYLSKEMREWA